MKSIGNPNERVVDVYGDDESAYPRGDIIIDYPDLTDFYFFNINVRQDELDRVVIEEHSLMTILNPFDEMATYLNFTFKDVHFDIKTFHGTTLPNGWIAYEATGYKRDHSTFKIMYICKLPVSVSKKLH